MTAAGTWDVEGLCEECDGADISYKPETPKRAPLYKTGMKIKAVFKGFVARPNWTSSTAQPEWRQDWRPATVESVVDADSDVHRYMVLFEKEQRIERTERALSQASTTHPDPYPDLDAHCKADPTNFESSYSCKQIPCTCVFKSSLPLKVGDRVLARSVDSATTYRPCKIKTLIKVDKTAKGEDPTFAVGVKWDVSNMETFISVSLIQGIQSSHIETFRQTVQPNSELGKAMKEHIEKFKEMARKAEEMKKAGKQYLDSVKKVTQAMKDKG